MNQNNKGLLLVALAGVCWSTTGIFANTLLSHGLSAYEVAFSRLFIGSTLFLIYFILKERHLLKLDFMGLILTFFMGIMTQGLFNIAFFSAIDKIGVIHSTVLLYLAPLFITIFSVLLYKEKLTREKVFGVALSILGSFLALTSGKLDLHILSLSGLALGLYAGLGYSLVSVFSKFGLKKYQGKTLIFYSFLFGLIFILPFADLSLVMTKIHIPAVSISMIGLGFIAAALAYILYFEGIATGLELSKVGVVSMIELILAIALSVLLVGESLTFIKIIGIILILVSIYVINKPTNAFDDFI